MEGCTTSLSLKATRFYEALAKRYRWIPRFVLKRQAFNGYYGTPERGDGSPQTMLLIT